MAWRRPRRAETEPVVALEGTVFGSEVVWSGGGDPQLSLDCLLGQADDPDTVVPVHVLAALPESAWLIGGLLGVLAEAREQGDEPEIAVRGQHVHLCRAGSRFRLALLDT